MTPSTRERVYDLFQAEKDYAGEIVALRALVLGHRPTSKAWLDVACGTGLHLAGLKRFFDL